MRNIEASLAWPLVILLILTALTPKPDGTLRAIGLTPTTYRVWARARRQEALEWEEAKAGFWDSAMRSSSALRAGVLRALANESAATIGMASATLLWDLEKFYDSVNLERLVSESIRLGFCAVILYLSLAMHTSVRIIKVQGHLAEGIHPTTGLVAGDTHAQTLANWSCIGPSIITMPSLLGPAPNNTLMILRRA